MRQLTLAKFTELVNELLIEAGIKNYEAYKTESTRFTATQIESGACRLRVYIKLKSESIEDQIVPVYFMCFYSLKEYQKYGLDKGHKLKLSKGRDTLLTDMQIDF